MMAAPVAGWFSSLGKDGGGPADRKSSAQLHRVDPLSSEDGIPGRVTSGSHSVEWYTVAADTGRFDNQNEST